MAKYCAHCKRPVTPKRKIGVGTLILALGTGGIWLLFIPFYVKRCPICWGTALKSKAPEEEAVQNDNSSFDPMEQLKKLQELKETGVLTEIEFNEKKAVLLEKI